MDMTTASEAVGTGSIPVGTTIRAFFSFPVSQPPFSNPNPVFSTVDLQEIRKIVELMNEHGLTHFDLTKKDFHLKLKKGADAEALHALLDRLPAAATAAAPHHQPAAAPTGGAGAEAAPEGSEITCPMVGTFYSRRSPDSPPLVVVGDTITVGQPLCIIEAMKVMNEITAEKAGVVTAIVAEDGAPVQFGDVLFRIR